MSQQLAAAPRGPAPFRLNAPRRLRDVASVAFANNAQINAIDLPNTGYLNGLFIRVSGTMTLSAGGALKDEAPWNLIKKIEVESNEGATAHVNLSGYGTFMEALIAQARGFRPDRAGMGDTTPHVDCYRAPVANGANLWTQWYFVPIALNRYQQRGLGLINLQARGLQVRLRITTEDGANVVTNFTSFVGTIDVFYEHFQVPQHFGPNGEVLIELPPMARVRTVEQIDVISNVGQEVKVEIPHDGALISLVHEVVINGARSDVIDGIRLVYNDDSNPLDYDRGLLRELARLHYGIEFPVGVYPMDFFASTQHVGDGDTPDWIDTTKIALIESRIGIPATAVLGANNNYVRTVRRYIQRARVAA